MSADNGIYIGRFKDEVGIVTFRVTHAQAIENCDYSDDFPNELTDASRVLYYGRSKVYTTEAEAVQRANEIYHEIMEGSCPILEYGVCQCWYDVPFPAMTPEEANEFQRKYWDEHYKGWEE